jgi:hypothetical protein
MKRLFVVAMTAVLAFPLLGTEAETKAEAKKDTAATAAEPATTAAPAAESPIVAAAKKTARSKSKSVVITDDMVKKSGGRLSTADSSYQPPPLPENVTPSAEVTHLQNRAKEKADAEKAAAEKKAAEEKEQLRPARLAASAEEHEDGYNEGQDPAAAEKDLADEAKRQEEKKP